MLGPAGKLPDWENFTDRIKAGIEGVGSGRGTRRKISFSAT